MEKLEEEQQEKDSQMKGEVFAKQRPLNSLLEEENETSRLPETCPTMSSLLVM